MPSLPGRSAGPDLAAVLVVLALSTGIAVLALATARGVMPLGDDTYDTEFISAWWWTALLLVPLPALAARRRTGTAVGTAAALVLPQVVAAAVCVHRYRASGWADGLETLAFLHPALLAALTLAAVALVRRTR